MKKTRKLMYLFLALVTICFTTFGCDSTSSNSESDSSEDTASTEESDTSEDDSTQTTNDSSDISFEELTVVDNDECLIKITGIEPDGSWGYTLNAYLENKSSETTYMFAVDDAAINGVSYDPLFASDVAAGKKSNEEIYWTTTTLEEYGVSNVTDIELTFNVYDSDDWSSDSVALETVHVYPFGEDQATTYTREPQDSDIILVDDSNVKVVVIGIEPDDTWGYTLDLYLENKTSADCMFSINEASVNGYMMDPFWATSIESNKVGFSSVSWSTSDFEDNNITDVETIEFLFTATNNDDYSADSYINETYTITP